MTNSVDTPEEFESKVLQSPDLARIEEESYDESENIITYTIYFSGSLASQISNDEIDTDSRIDAIVNRLLALGAQSVDVVDERKLTVEFVE